MSNLSYAIELATIFHRGQFRDKDEAGLSYIVHPLRVMVNEDFVRDDTDRMIAVMHDLIEDTSCTFDKLREEGFSDEVINGVNALTRREGEVYMDYIARCAENPRARRIKMADLKDNTRKSGMNDRYLRAFMYLMSKEKDYESVNKH